MARLVQYGTFPLQNIGIVEGAHSIATAEFKWHNWYSTARFLYKNDVLSDSPNYYPF